MPCGTEAKSFAVHPDVSVFDNADTYGLYTLEPSRSKENIIEDICFDAQYYKEWIYYSFDNTIYKVKPDGSKKTTVKAFSQNTCKQVLDGGKKTTALREELRSFKIAEDSIFYVMQHPPKNNNDLLKQRTLYVMQLNSKDSKAIQSCVDDDLWYAGGKLFYIDVSGHLNSLYTEMGEYESVDIGQYDISKQTASVFRTNLNKNNLNILNDRLYIGDSEIDLNTGAERQTPAQWELLQYTAWFQWLIQFEGPSIWLYDVTTGVNTRLMDLPVAGIQSAQAAVMPEGVYILAFDANNNENIFRLYMENMQFKLERLS